MKVDGFLTLGKNSKELSKMNLMMQKYTSTGELAQLLQSKAEPKQKSVRVPQKNKPKNPVQKIKKAFSKTLKYSKKAKLERKKKSNKNMIKVVHHRKNRKSGEESQ